MRKLILVMAMILMTGMVGFAQNFDKGSSGINAGIGLGPGYYGGGYGFAFGVNGSYEYGIVKIPMGDKLHGVIGIGGLAGISWTTSNTYGGDWRYTNWTIAARGTYHFIFMDKFDPYAGILLGYRGQSWKWTGTGSGPWDAGSSGGFTGGFFVGARYYFSDGFGVYAELGYLLNVLNVGVTFKIN
jgi:hypothetical protein